ncbi:C-type lectin domain-containing protein [Caenorhabditis elegans]|uniref:C-type lectin domain-containing protein n=1 Tax=Caenorhabditis elegans TaxID=6239 RepID=Q9TYL4_CAEEL|nr:C-type lectin domain-containing protein [Caenorhabditis elegans]CCD61980.2 C-type lectin domain-containing protein [Caenorhabditis elegans]|eukprot:NP_001317732.1 C-type LECtin [Caenorhabditis elegans]
MFSPTFKSFLLLCLLVVNSWAQDPTTTATSTTTVPSTSTVTTTTVASTSSGSTTASTAAGGSTSTTAAGGSTASTAAGGSTSTTAAGGSTASTAAGGPTGSTAAGGSTASTAAGGSTASTAAGGSTASTVAGATSVVPSSPAPPTQPPVNNGCELGWKFFNRPSGGWCIKVFPGYFALKEHAENACQANGAATLTGLQNKAEALFIQSSMLSEMSAPSGSVWIGIHRTPACNRKPLSAQCNKNTAFRWTDKSATGVDGFVFQRGQPDNGGRALNQNCALLLASSKPFIDAGGRYYAAQMEDVHCNATFVPGNMARKTSGYACGKPNKCQPGWKFFDRQSGGWCMKVFTGFHAAKVDAEAACKDVGATLSGLENKEEAIFIQNALLARISQASGSVWIGIQRKAECLGKGLTASGTPTTSFEWTDNSASGVGGMVFQAGQPDNGVTALNQNCALLLASSQPYIDARGRFYAATMEDVPCVANFVASNEARRTRGYVCGKPL